MQLRQIVAVVDASPAGVQAAWRAARLAWAHGATLSLVAPMALPDRHPASRHGPSAPPVRMRAALADLAGAMVAAIGIQPAVAVDLDAGALLQRQLRTADLLVVPAAAARAGTAAWWHGSLAERLLRETGVPVLIVRRPAGTAYRSALVATGLDAEMASPLLRAARRLCRPDGVLACHVLDPAIQHHLHAADLPLSTVQSWMETATRRAELALGQQLVQAGMQAEQALVLQGPALVRLLHAQHSRGPSLVVVGKPRRKPWADLLKPALARQLAARVACDVLWLAAPLPGAQVARQRLGRTDAAPPCAPPGRPPVLAPQRAGAKLPP
ncbi:universal stress protein [Pseudorhodoferax sp.]|uniref:universal stress protein n=1 Tax=Pseudorhodoferax sp. TaxID=1993553 RepID=UPI002DD68C5B|nr:universal stress protein [Pseudorhodoferax sp.]